MNKRRVLNSGQEVIIIYEVDVGFIQQLVTFKEYRIVDMNGVKCNVPIFARSKSEINGLQCFWVLPTDIKSDQEIALLQRELIGLQFQASAIGYLLGYEVPEKIKDREIQKMVASNISHRMKLKAELGYDPLDYSWVEKELSSNSLEREWFQHMRECKGSLTDDWDTNIKSFRQKYHSDISIEQAFDLSRKWKRYLIGAWNTIASQNANMEDWKRAAREFESYHKQIELRMMEWTAVHLNNFPLAKVIKPVHFRHGPYFNQCVERVPHLFTDATCFELRIGVILQVVSYDPQEKYIRLDFTSDIREKIKPGIVPNDPCMPLKADYVIYVLPTQIENHLEFLSPL